MNAWTFYKQGVEIISYEYKYFNALACYVLLELKGLALTEYINEKRNW